MLPSLLVEEVQHGLVQSLLAQFEPSNPLFKEAINRLLSTPDRWMKGPYVQVSLPFEPGTEGTQFFKGFKTQFPGHRHQEAAWTRLSRQQRPTLVATGTGSGKTECFQYPILEHVARAVEKGERGIKAIIVYPMNALADDQAERFAELVHRTPAFSKVRVGLFVGSGKTKYKPSKKGGPAVSDTTVMGPNQVITDKDTLRANPPDILLTNYKMLDFLLIRPNDQPLWEHNTPSTLRYLVVDELHTFDGAQGTDLAMLIRRLKHRLGADDKQIISIGTSATLGDAQDTSKLREYAGQVFATQFDEQAVITESRQTFERFLAGALVEYSLNDDAVVREAVSRRRYDSQVAAVRAAVPAFFSDPDLQARLLSQAETPEGRLLLGTALRSHLLFVNLMRVLATGIHTLDAIASRLERTLSSPLRPLSVEIIQALLVLISWARASLPREGGSPLVVPLLNVRLQLWTRELRRMVATVSEVPADIAISSEGDLDADQNRIHLPIIQCSHCRHTGWLTLQRAGRNRLETELSLIYNAYFSYYKDINLRRLYVPEAGIAQGKGLIPLIERKVCADCGEMQSIEREECLGCTSPRLARIAVAQSTRTRKVDESMNGVTSTEDRVVHDDTCPNCGARDCGVLLGARATTLAATSIERLWSSPANDHKKLILFSDSVQDAAHRAGYIEAKTDAHHTRGAITKAILQAGNQTRWTDFLSDLPSTFRDPKSPHFLPDTAYVSAFIGPDMEWRRDWRQLKEDGGLPPASVLPDLVSRRLIWRAIEELGHLSERGPTIQRVGIAALFPDRQLMSAACNSIRDDLEKAFGGSAQFSVRSVRNWVFGTVLQLIRRGAILYRGLEGVRRTGNFRNFEFQESVRDWIPHRGDAPAPRFLAFDFSSSDFLTTEESETNPLTQWFYRCLADEGLFVSKASTLAYQILVRHLEAFSLGSRDGIDRGDRSGFAFGLAPEHLYLHTDLVRLRTRSRSHTLWIPRGQEDDFLDMEAWDAVGERFTQVEDHSDWWAERLGQGDVCRVLAHEHTGLLERDERVSLQNRFVAKDPQPWFENLLSATPTLEMGVNIGDLSSVMLCGVPPNQASYLQRIGRAGRRDGNAAVFTMAEASSDAHDLFYFEDPMEMLAGSVDAPAIFLGAAEVLRRQLYAFFFDQWVGDERPEIPDKLSAALDEVDREVKDETKFPFNYLAFIGKSEPVVFDRFCRMLGKELDDRPATRQKLEDFLKPSDEQKDFRTRFLSFFEEAALLRKGLRQRQDRIRKQIEALKKKPEDEQRNHEIEQLEYEKAAVGGQVSQLNSEQMLEAITNAGLLPNYAFPEEGVTLDTVVRIRRERQGQQEELPVALHNYSRPAHAALSEFAPRNAFYGHKSKVRINQIDLSLEEARTHRLCACCHHIALSLPGVEEASTCPKCDDGRWGDTSQTRPMLRLRRAVANIDKKHNTQIREGDEQRSPVFFNRQLLMNFRADQVRSAWRAESPEAVYGFEFLNEADFHDINTGELSGRLTGPQIAIAGDETPKPGFALCSECGMVQPPPFGAAEEDRKQEHLPDCKYRHVKGPDHLQQDLFLYRQFKSECLRIMVPQGMGSDPETVHSFTAAIQLGMRRVFGGKIDHLRFDTMDAASEAGSLPKSYVLIYDAVPGGTGYLQQLLSGEADTLADVIRRALGAVSTCRCITNDKLDGCYHCVYQPQQGRNRDHVSRRRAEELLGALAKGDFKFTKIESVSEIFVKSDFGSELEKRFLASLRAIGGAADIDPNQRLPAVNIVADVVEAETAFLLTVGSYRYWVRQQVDIPSPDGIGTLCKPDFLIYPSKSGAVMKPIAVFIDGWEYHYGISADDARKRAALVACGKYHAWSIAHRDIEEALKGIAKTDLAPLPGFLNPSGESQLKKELLPVPDSSALSRNAVAQLIALLGAHDPVQKDVISTLEATAGHLTLRAILNPPKATPADGERIASVLAALPDWSSLDGPTLRLLGAPARVGVDASSPFIQLVGEVLRSYVAKQPSDRPVRLVLTLNGDSLEHTNPEHRMLWRQWLRAYNLLQALPGTWIATESQIQTGALGTQLAPPQKEAAGALSPAWNAALDYVLERLRPALVGFADKGLPSPDDVGVEFDDEQGYRAAEAVWPAVVLLSAGQVEFAEAWKSAGYHPVLEAPGWEQELADRLATGVTA